MSWNANLLKNLLLCTIIAEEHGGHQHAIVEQRIKPFVALPHRQCMDGNFYCIEGYGEAYGSEYWLLIQPAAYQWQDNHAEDVKRNEPTIPVEALRHSKEVLNKIF